MEKQNIKINWTLFYAIALILFTTFVLLDTFVIPKTQQTVSDSVDYQTTLNTENINSEYADNSYTDDNITINIETIEKYDTQIYIADIQLSNVVYLKSAFAKDTFGRNIKEKASTMAENNDAILAINGDYYGFRDDGFVLRNGTLYRNTARDKDDDEAFVIYKDGSCEVVNENDSNAENLLENGAVQIYSFGPSLVLNGKIVVNKNTEVDQSMASNPRTAICMIEPLHYLFVVSDGRTSESAGISLYELATILEDYNCEIAYNFDGGGSSVMWFNGEVINNPTTNGKKIEERTISDIVYIGY